ncbi:MAG: fasciclin domain-containing protein [Candidatus Bathyarchaeota archaeon]|nr:fasciclin domain-containing protein [Candidatus Bathyarchaeota archaeon]
MADIVDAAMSAGMFNTLVTAVKAAGLVDTLKSPGPFTVFAPNDAAFAKLPQGTIDALLNDIPKLKTILTYHVVSGKYTSAEVAKQKRMTTVEGEDLKIDAAKWRLHNSIKVNDANIINLDIMVDNGVCHAIDKVLMPKMEMMQQH